MNIIKKPDNQKENDEVKLAAFIKYVICSLVMRHYRSFIHVIRNVTLIASMLRSMYSPFCITEIFAVDILVSPFWERCIFR